MKTFGGLFEKLIEELELEELETPAVVVDLETLDRNLRRMAEAAKAAGVKLRPHTKTHKNAWIAHQQLRYGATGITTAKLSEAEVMADAGVDDILVAYPIVGKAKLERLARLRQRARITVSTDDVAVAKGLSDLGEATGSPVSLYVDVNTGLNRCGREPGEETVELVKALVRLPGIRVAGLMTHPGHAYATKSREALKAAAKDEADQLVRTQAMLRKAGIEVGEVSIGSTPTAAFVAEQTGVTEMRPGSYVFNDLTQLDLSVAGIEDCALYVAATVVSAPRPGMVVIDAGSKTFSSDTNPHRSGFGIVNGREDTIVERLSEEHGTIRVPEDVQFSIGDKVWILPNHCCTTTNMHDRILGARRGRIERELRVDGRGKVQ